MRPRKFGPGARPSTFRNRSRSRCRRNATTSDPPRARSRRLAFRRTRRIMGCMTLSAAPWVAARGRRRSSRSARHGYQTLGYLRPEAGSGFPTLWGTPWDVFSGKLGKCMPGKALTEIVVLPLLNVPSFPGLRPEPAARHPRPVPRARTRRRRAAKAVRQRLHAVLEWAIAVALRDDNPCDRANRAARPGHGILAHRRRARGSEPARGMAPYPSDGGSLSCFAMSRRSASRSGLSNSATRSWSMGPTMISPTS